MRVKGNKLPIVPHNWRRCESWHEHRYATPEDDSRVQCHLLDSSEPELRSPMVSLPSVLEIHIRVTQFLDIHLRVEIDFSPYTPIWVLHRLHGDNLYGLILGFLSFSQLRHVYPVWGPRLSSYLWFRPPRLSSISYMKEMSDKNFGNGLTRKILDSVSYSKGTSFGIKEWR